MIVIHFYNSMIIVRIAALNDLNMQFWLVTTEHLKDRLWFMDAEDFKMAMNTVAVLSVVSTVKIIAFILMSNHVHFVLGGSMAKVEEFIMRFKKNYAQHYYHKYARKELLRRNGVDLREVRIEDESFERAVAYVHMNCVAANITLTASDYPWGTGGSFFSVSSPQGYSVKDISGRALSKIVRSKVALPPDYIMDYRGFILPSSYVCSKLVESVFRTPKRMNYFLHNSSKAQKINEAPSFPDQVVSAGLKSLLASLFRKNSIFELSDTQKSELFKQLRYRFSSDPNQLARVSGLPYEEICRLLELI